MTQAASAFVVKSPMDLFDVVFPLNIGPLTYRRPSGYKGELTPGMLVRAEVKRTLQYGIILGETPGYSGHNVKEIADVVDDMPLYSRQLLKLLTWMAEYYISPAGVALKSMLPREVFAKSRPRSQEEAASHEDNRQREPCPIDRAFLSPVMESISQPHYRSFLLHAPSARYEISFLLETIKGARNVIILAPEITIIEEVAGIIRDIAEERLVVLHGQLSAARKRFAFRQILSGKADIVLGTRPAVFAPLKSLSLIAVLQEQNRAYKNLEGLRYHARDVAVMRCYLEKAPVLLTSPTPSMESFYNTIKGKYVLLQPDIQVRRPVIEVINMKTAKKTTPYISKPAFDAAATRVRNGGSVLFLINRKGYSMIQCSECDEIPSCPECRLPLIYHKNGPFLKCHYCSYTSRVPVFCTKCRSTNLEMVGAGTQRIAAELKRLLGAEPLRFDKDALRDSSDLRALSDFHGEKIVVGTKAIKSRLRSGGACDLCVFLNPDLGLHLPDFRSSEALFQEILGMAEFTRPDGLIILQTRMPGSSVYKYAKRYGYTDFFAHELSARKSLAYPPFSRLIGITVSSKTDVSGMIAKATTFSDGEVDVIGPSSSSRQGTYIWKVLMKSRVKEKLNRCARAFLDQLKDKKGIRTVIDVDPISL
jgi:primosomal protein N' (replication factor Y)